ncbi:hypothetical protein B1808_14370 [Pseudofulvimonas gallinarii]|nr:hypothetical protein B1808_14370 [Pseudofulvimonas gallinarii]
MLHRLPLARLDITELGLRYSIWIRHQFRRYLPQQRAYVRIADSQQPLREQHSQHSVLLLQRLATLMDGDR